MWGDTQERGGSCELGFANERKSLLTTDGRQVPEDLLEKMKSYTRELRRKFPHMKPKRVERKVAEYFKIKLV